MKTIDTLYNKTFFVKSIPNLYLWGYELPDIEVYTIQDILKSFTPGGQRLSTLLRKAHINKIAIQKICEDYAKASLSLAYTVESAIDLNFNSSYYGNSSSCWFGGCYNHSRLTAMRTAANMDNFWIVKIYQASINYGLTLPENVDYRSMGRLWCTRHLKNSNNYLFFNAYPKEIGVYMPILTDIQARLDAPMLEKIGLYSDIVDRQTIYYINNDRGFNIGDCEVESIQLDSDDYSAVLGDVCCNCNTIISDDDRIEHNGDFYCEDCFYELFSYCEYCDEYHSVEDMAYSDEGFKIGRRSYNEICISTLEYNGFFQCYDCNKWSNNGGRVHAHYYCEECLDRVAAYCNECEEYHWQDEVDYIDCQIDGVYYDSLCIDCQNELHIQLCDCGNWYTGFCHDCKAQCECCESVVDIDRMAEQPEHGLRVYKGKLLTEICESCALTLPITCSTCGQIIGNNPCPDCIRI